MSTIGIVTGLPFECKLVERVSRRLNWSPNSPVCRPAGIGGASSREIVRHFSMLGVSGIVSFGIAGGLDPDLQTGTVVIPRSIYSGIGEKYDVHKQWQGSLETCLKSQIPIVSTGLYCSRQLVAKRATKHDLFDKTNAAAVDMESFEVAEAASEFSLPFVAIRAIADTAHDELPEAIEAATGPDGLNYRSLTTSILKRPSQLISLGKTGASTRTASKALSKACRIVGPDMALV